MGRTRRLEPMPAMTPSELDDAIDALVEQAAGEGDLLPGLITVKTDDWVGSLRGLRAPCAALHDGMRHREVVIHVGSAQDTRVLTRAEAGGRGGPYRDPSQRA